jgi:hypothetical protein
LGINVLDLIKTQVYEVDDAYIIPAHPAVGNLYISKNNLSYITGYVRTRGRNNGRYPYNYLEMIDRVFGFEKNTIEVCSNSVSNKNCFTVDIREACSPSVVDDAQLLSKIKSNSFDRWRCDPPYNERTAEQMYNTSLPDVGKILKAGARVVKHKGLMFLLLGNVNRQACPSEIKRIGHITLSVIPNNENRSLHVYYKLADDLVLDYRLPEVKIGAPYLIDDSCNLLKDPKNLQRNSSYTQAAGGDVK